jgi:hypothetical protein
MIKKLKNHKSAQAHIVEGNDEEYLISYRTEVLIIDYNTNIMEVTGLYSMTTRRHISWYLMERFPHIDYYTVKKAYEEGKKVNIITGQLI